MVSRGCFSYLPNGWNGESASEMQEIWGMRSCLAASSVWTKLAWPSSRPSFHCTDPALALAPFKLREEKRLQAPSGLLSIQLGIPYSLGRASHQSTPPIHTRKTFSLAKIGLHKKCPRSLSQASPFSLPRKSAVSQPEKPAGPCKHLSRLTSSW